MKYIPEFHELFYNKATGTVYEVTSIKTDGFGFSGERMYAMDASGSSYIEVNESNKEEFALVKDVVATLDPKTFVAMVFLQEQIVELRSKFRF